ncbi:MAG: hypothetical protein ACRDF7_04595 [Candidatus Limnocylindrales bacterium]
MSPSRGPAADAARADFRAIATEKGHATEIAARALARLESAFVQGALVRTPFIDQAIADLGVALEQDEGQKLGGKSAEASRFILRAIDRMLDDA